MSVVNPKDRIGGDKVPLHLWPPTATTLGAMALLDGALKYGRSNWRVAGVRASIYYDAATRHLTKWFFGGERIDPDSGIHHLGHLLACIAILVDAEAAGTLIDDRDYPGGYLALLEEQTPHVHRMKVKYADRTPKHYTLSDADPDPEVPR